MKNSVKIFNMIFSKILSTYGATTIKNPFPTFSERFLVLIFGCLTLLVCCSCGSTKVATQLVRDVRIDTVYLSNVQYDSIYIMQDKLIDRTRDTLYIKDKSIEYHYKILRDTVKVIQRDSIPYQVTVVETKEITRPLTWFDKLCRSCFYLLSGALLFWIYTKAKKHFR